MDKLEIMYNSIIKQLYILNNKDEMRVSLVLLKRKNRIRYTNKTIQ
mgnify:CR=1 FL=1